MLMKNLTVQISRIYENKSFKRKRFRVRGRIFLFFNVRVLGRVRGPAEEKGK
jgi:hypothetical protein